VTFVKPSVATFSQQPLPTMYDLPSEHPEDAGLPDEFHWSQADLLKKTFQPATYPADRVFSAADMNLYYDPQNHGYYKRPDWFGVVDVPRKIDDGRMSYVRWQERHSPIIVVELLSPRTTEEDQGLTLRGRTPPSKWEVYESILRVPYYVLFDKPTSTFRMFELQGTAYLELFQERLWIEEIGIGLGVWQGTYLEDERLWLRWYDAAGNWLPTPDEKAQRSENLARQAEEQARQAEEQARQAENLARQAENLARQAEEQARRSQNLARQNEERAQTEREGRLEAEQRAAVLAERLRSLGVDPEDL
jgi:Uma2 family endonuclease